MVKNRQRLLQIVGVVGTLSCLVLFIRAPSFPTPDKIIVFLLFVFMMFQQAIVMLKHLLPFMALILVHESFRGIAHHLNSHVNYLLLPRADRAIFGDLPTDRLQDWLWRGHVQWYDFVLYLAYMMYFVFPVALAILIWKTRERWYWRFVTAYISLSFAAFLTFLAFPAAPPWLASDGHYIEHVERISSHVWYALGIHDFPTLYNHIAPNPVAAVPSLHAAAATLFCIFVWRLYGRKWGLLATTYPLMIYFGTVYQAEHYAIDAIVGALYAGAAYLAAPSIMRGLSYLTRRFGLKKRSPVIPKAFQNQTDNKQKPD